ncbi:MAG: hypothetical protein KDD75_20155 [Caldilineaceae bacterium]|nr:hypothetical protein [Caldilineaceae bacterium]
MTDSKDAIELPPHFVSNILNVFGEDGAGFLRALPALVGEMAERWELTLLPEFDNLSFNYVCPAICRDGSEVVLKLGVPHRELLTGIEAIGLYGGNGCARLIDAAPDRGALLLERLQPGALLRPLVLEDDAAATAIVADVMAALWQPVPEQHTLLTIREWAQQLANLRPTFDGSTGPFPPYLVDAAERLFAELIASSGPLMVLHGDLHHDNIISAQRAPWLAIDPQGVAGEREYEIGALLYNPLRWLPAQPDVKRIEARRIDQVADRLGLDRQRLLGWGIAQCVLSAWWDYDGSADGGDLCRETLYLAEVLCELR